MKIDRRPEPYVTAAMREKIERQILPRYENRMGALLPCLHEVQHAYGWIPAQAMEEIAGVLGLKPSEVYDTASFYEEYWLKPKGAHLIAVCRSIACECMDYRAITGAVKARLGIEVGETTEDGRFTLVEVECLGSCDTAPVALVDERLHENLTPESVIRAIDAAGKGGGHH
ncbi:MAG: NADH-quinone oxidoreductase subunit NuoE [Phycisphaeraceae bacterium]|nr:MAG: NADH-quinone oxidoreductase subunit NuoE [Phycisphaeraceae bacterium]